VNSHQTAWLALLLCLAENRYFLADPVQGNKPTSQEKMIRSTGRQMQDALRAKQHPAKGIRPKGTGQGDPAKGKQPEQRKWLDRLSAGQHKGAGGLCFW
jgi:hypothetical protein